ncbi:MAG: squalene/phytoene synthase family protein [Bacteroidota bacterium]
MNAQLSQLLAETSRTFAVCIPVLPPPVERQVTLAYLLFRIVDTYEDAAVWTPQQRTEVLQEFIQLMDERASSEAFAALPHRFDPLPTTHAGYQNLLTHSPFVMQEFYALPEAVQQIIWSHLRRTTVGMIHFLSQTNEANQIRLKSLAELEHYCYTVAGIVGEMLTELFLFDPKHRRSLPQELMRLASSLGNGLQLTNILKDQEEDQAEGKFYVPHAVARPQMVALAKEKLQDGLRYIKELEFRKVPNSIAKACKLPTLWAQATIQQIESFGAGAKISREELGQIFTSVMAE